MCIFTGGPRFAYSEGNSVGIEFERWDGGVIIFDFRIVICEDAFWRVWACCI